MLNKPLTSRERQGLLACLCAIPAFFVGIYLSNVAQQIGWHLDFESILKRGGVCAIPAVLLALILPHYWLIPSILYGVGFYFGYTFTDGLTHGIIIGLGGLFSALVGQPIGQISEPSHPELLWIYLIALWTAAFASILRHQFGRKRKGMA